MKLSDFKWAVIDSKGNVRHMYKSRADARRLVAYERDFVPPDMKWKVIRIYVQEYHAT